MALGRRRPDRSAAPDQVAYPLWATWLAGFARGEHDRVDGLPALVLGELGQVAATRVSERCAAALRARLDLWSAAFSRDLRAATSDISVQQALTAGRARLEPVHRLVESELLFGELREGLGEGVTDSLRQAQEELEREARRVGGRDETLLRAVRDQPIHRRLRLELHDAPAGSPHAAGRRVLIGGHGA